ncbi:glycosyltransferase [uncultured Parabacteroides sp.]|uniref:glycosyltransferase family 4 protein n=1 Tax=Parabacteroides goldsteinii TaxID=328812 RepID=UPI002592CE7C|nr:glycosyltransferase [uncultured Parabacteroides sp.]
MEIAFFTNSLNLHQLGLADELYHLTGGKYMLIETQPLSEERRKMGFVNYDRPYVLEAYASDENQCRSYDIARNVDVAIMGANSFPYLETRIKKGGKLTFSFSERWLKQGIKNLLSPRLLQQMKLYYLYGRNQPWYILCASAFLPSDYNLLRAFKGKCYKWGYFTSVPQIDVNSVLSAKRDTQKIKILWVARYLGWKHPEQMVSLALQLRQRGVDFEINMVGLGYMYEDIGKEIGRLNLSDSVHQLGNMSNLDVIKLMQNHQIFCFTSDRNEGWGAVLGEAMSNACSVVASTAAGATPFLVQDNINGLLFDLSKKDDLFNKVVKLIENHQMRESISRNAYYTMRHLWNPHNAAEKFIQLADSLLQGTACEILDGPCSKAKVL